MAGCQEEICLLVQVETQAALDEIEAIASVDGVDGIFIGPADLSASLGFPVQLRHPKVLTAIEDEVKRIRLCGKAAGTLIGGKILACHFIEIGTLFTAVGVDAGLLARAADELAADF
jgi:4-hydroxy-2-oxoheptanedioate aldolase